MADESGAERRVLMPELRRFANPPMSNHSDAIDNAELLGEIPEASRKALLAMCQDLGLKPPKA